MWRKVNVEHCEICKNMFWRLSSKINICKSTKTCSEARIHMRPTTTDVENCASMRVVGAPGSISEHVFYVQYSQLYTKEAWHTTGRIFVFFLPLEYSLRISRIIISSRDLSITVFCTSVVLSNSLSSQRFFSPQFPSTNPRLGCFSMCWHQAGETNPWVGWSKRV
jgi:hypothetical protein